LGILFKGLHVGTPENSRLGIGKKQIPVEPINGRVLIFDASLLRSVIICEANSVDANIAYADDSHVSAKPSLPVSLPDPSRLRSVLAYWIRFQRVKKGWSQERLALECDLDRTYVSAVERLRWNVSLSNIERLARALDVPAWSLLKPPEHTAAQEADDETHRSELANDR
jgi:hypothetical protein